MQVRVWSKKVVSVLRYFHHHPHCTLFGVTGDIDNLGIYVARQGRAKAEILVDTYNRLVGVIFCNFIESHPHEFFEVCFLPAGEEVFILGTIADSDSARLLFDRFHSVGVARILHKNSPINIGSTNITFGCNTFDSDFMSSKVSALLDVVENGNMSSANTLYAEVLGEIRLKLSIELDRRKFSDMEPSIGDEILLRNLVYLKTIQYKEETRKLLVEVNGKLKHSPEIRQTLKSLIGDKYGLQDVDSTQLLKTVSELLIH